MHEKNTVSNKTYRSDGYREIKVLSIKVTKRSKLKFLINTFWEALYFFMHQIFL